MRGRRCPRATAGAVPLPCHTLPAEQEPAGPVLSPGEALLFHPAASPPPPADDTGEGLEEGTGRCFLGPPPLTAARHRDPPPPGCHHLLPGEDGPPGGGE